MVEDYKLAGTVLAQGRPNDGRGKRIVRSAAPLREQAVATIRDAITTGEYAPGHRLTETSLCDTLGVSRTVVREALRQLESEQLISIVPNVGPMVRALTPDDARHLYEARGALESLAAELAAARATPADIASLRGIVEQLKTPAADGLDVTIQLKDEFYALLVQASENEVIGQMLSNIHARTSQLRRLTLSSESRRPQMLAELTLILDALEAGDARAAAQASRQHVAAAEEIALRGLATSQG